MKEVYSKEVYSNEVESHDFRIKSFSIPLLRISKGKRKIVACLQKSHWRQFYASLKLRNFYGDAERAERHQDHPSRTLKQQDSTADGPH
jgi:hypothetical protein